MARRRRRATISHIYNVPMPAAPPIASTDASGRHLSPLDRLITEADRLLKSAMGPHLAGRPYPATDLPEKVTDPAARRHAAALMRVNHAGEIAAQALYHGHALTARETATRRTMLESAAEETDHLAWCAQRITELGGRTSLLDPLWYAGSFAIGVASGLAGDRHSLGFVAETERQVVEHLAAHLRELPTDDVRTRAVIEQMSRDEAKHGGGALAAGGVIPPGPIRRLMTLTARVMTSTARWL